MRLILLYTFAFCFSIVTIHAQNTRLTNYNSIGWYNYFGTFKLNQKLSIHTEYQFRRSNIISNWQQSLLRAGFNYQANPKVQFRLGYGWIETFPYGEIPINEYGKVFTEHRLFQVATLTDEVSIINLSHRFMLEQRWVGKYTRSSLKTEDEFVFLNRFRYMFRCDIPINAKEMNDHTAYLAIYDELFLGFGENVNENVFDQNRLGILFGYKFNKVVRIEAGYLNQSLQLGREVNTRNVFQDNNGIILNATFNIDLRKKE